jgi:hypothetical protein
MKGTTTNGGKEVPRIYGAFVQGKIPECPAQMYDVEGDYPIHQTQGDFIFGSVQGHGEYFFEPHAAGEAMAEVYLDYEAGGAISVLAQWITLTWSYDWSFTYGNYLGKPIDVPGLTAPKAA